ncbi:MAG: hypothetical protein HFE83_09090 [Lachnospiraceae bacterium]|nr:hypothetical protein [Lachnospiraceae bacterium]
MKVLTMYLPQFHRVEENDLWWGEGFTDWVSARNAKPLFEGHYQPHVPLNGNYYDLLDKNTMRWQADLMRRYEVDGACMYHYWFKDGKRILEKPAENLLGWKDIQMPFCFCWANPAWARSWSGFRDADVWSSLYERQGAQKGSGILLEQKYGGRRQWKEHFEYLLPFFLDSRYVKMEGKPLFMIYHVSDIPCLGEMLECWRTWAGEAGLPGLYVIGARCSEHKEGLDAQIFLEPAHGRQGGTAVTYQAVWKNILQEKRGNLQTFFSGFTGYDDTPRQGRAGTVIEGSEPELFGEFLAELMAKNAANGSEIVFLNAWNEWGEGMHLEPDERFGTGYLEKISYAKAVFTERKSKYTSDWKEEEQTNGVMKRLGKAERYLDLMDQWMRLRERKIRLADCLTRAGVRSVAIYGWSIFGRHLLWELAEDGIQIVGIIDRQKDRLHVEYPVYLPTESLPKFDAMLVASWYFFDEIRAMFADRNYHLLSLETMIREAR